MLFEKLTVYLNSIETEAIQKGYEIAVQQLFADAEDAELQSFVVSATWGLADWEKMLSLKTDPSISTQVRRERVISKLRGSGVSTVKMIETVAESYYNGDCAITEQYADYTFTITFLSTRGRPVGLEQLQEAIEEIKPAHLHVIYVFLYTTHDELRPFTHNYLAGFTHDKIRVLEQTGG